MIANCIIFHIYNFSYLFSSVFNNCITYNGRTSNYGLLSLQCLEDLEKLIDENDLRKYLKQEESKVQ